MHIFRKQKFACFSRSCYEFSNHGHLKIHQFNRQFSLSHQIMIVNIKSIKYKIAFNIKSILNTVNYMIIRKMTRLISNIHNIMPKVVSYLQIYVLKISLIELILWSIRLNFVSKNYLWAKIICEQKLNQSVNTSDCQRSEARAPKASSLSPEKIFLHA